MHSKNEKDLLKSQIKLALSSKTYCSDKDLSFAVKDKSLLAQVLHEMQDELIFIEYINYDMPATIHTIYFPKNTAIQEPNFSLKGRFLSDEAEHFYSYVLNNNILEIELFFEMDISERLKFFGAVENYCDANCCGLLSLDKRKIGSILKDLLKKGEILLKRKDNENN